MFYNYPATDFLIFLRKVKGDDMRGSTGRVEFAENGRRKNVNITILEMSKDGFVDVRHSELSLNNKPLSRDFLCYFANVLRFFLT